MLGLKQEEVPLPTAEPRTPPEPALPPLAEDDDGGDISAIIYEIPKEPERSGGGGWGSRGYPGPQGRSGWGCWDLGGVMEFGVSLGAGGSVRSWRGAWGSLQGFVSFGEHEGGASAGEGLEGREAFADWGGWS